MSLPGVKAHDIQQRHVGQDAVKPTRLLSIRAPSLQESLEQGKTHGNVLCRPLVGRDENGHYRTARAREYPAALCRAMAEALLNSACAAGYVTHEPEVQDEHLNYLSSMQLSGAREHHLD